MADRPKTSWIPLVLIAVALSLIVHGLVTRDVSLGFDAAVVELVDGDADKDERTMLLQVVADQGRRLAAERKEAHPAVLAFVATLLLAHPGGSSGDCTAVLNDPWAKKSAFVPGGQIPGGQIPGGQIPGGQGAESAKSVEAVCLGSDRVRHLLLGYRAANLGELDEARQRFTWAENSARLWGHGACEELAAAAIKKL